MGVGVQHEDFNIENDDGSLQRQFRSSLPRWITKQETFQMEEAWVII